MQRLLDLGFQYIGNWQADADSISHNIVQHLNENNLLYVFAVDNTPLYIGKTMQTLQNRMNGYRNGQGTQRTNIRIKANLREKLLNGSQPKIYILLDNANLKFGNYNINLAAGLEDNLIYELAPAWNFRGNTRIIENEIPADDEGEVLETNIAVELDENERPSFPVTLTQTYLGGVLNFPAHVRAHLPEALPTRAQVILDENFIFEVNLLDAGNNCPRITSRIYRDWLTQNNMQIDDRVVIEIVEPTLFRISRL